jgi:indole-3-glycerol phosphate synthase
MSSVLNKICQTKKEHVAKQKTLYSLNNLEDLVKEQESPRGFIRALKANTPALIAEVKKASPSKGIIRQDFDPVSIAKSYESAGASCLSVLTDTPYFQGSDDYFRIVKGAIALPMLRKDFMVDPYQIIESRTLGADCILLIMAHLSDDQAQEFYALATDLGMDSLFEVHDIEELERALKLTPKMVGVNNRNLKTLKVDLQTGLDLAKEIPIDILKVAESGLNSNQDIQTFQSAGFAAFLVGESLMRQENIEEATRILLGKI